MMFEVFSISELLVSTFLACARQKLDNKWKRCFVDVRSDFTMKYYLTLHGFENYWKASDIFQYCGYSIVF